MATSIYGLKFIHNFPIPIYKGEFKQQTKIEIMKRFIVKIDETKVNDVETLNGYLGCTINKLGSTNPKSIFTYRKGESLKKAKMFDGKVEEYKGKYQISNPISMVQIPSENLPDIVKAFFAKEEPAYVDFDQTIGEKIYYTHMIEEKLNEADMFENAYRNDKGSRGELKKELFELYQQVSEFDYVVFTKA